MADLPGGIPQRAPTPSEQDFFRRRPEVSGYAAEDNAVVLTPESGRTSEEQDAVALNEAARIFLRLHPALAPDFELTPEQWQRFADYGSLDDIRATIAARLFSRDPSALNPTPEQRAFVERLSRLMGLATPGGRR